MKNFAKKMEDFLLKISNTFARSVTLSIISSAFMMIMPFTIVGSFASLFKGIDIGGYQSWLQSTPLYNTLGAVYQFTVGLLAVYIVFCVGYQAAVKKQMKKQAITIGLTALMAFLIITPYTPGPDAYSPATLTTSWLGSSGMFMAILVGFITCKIYQLCAKYHIEIKMPEQVPPTIAKQFNAIIPSAIVAIFFMLVNILFGMTPFGNVQDALYSIIRIPLSAIGGSIWGIWLLQVLVYTFWFFGIHGGMSVGPFLMLLCTPLQMANLAAYQAGAELPNLITGTVIQTGSGSLVLLVAALFVCKAEANKTITKLAIIPALFGVDEPAYFGFPMIMNPIFFIPWVILVPTINVFGTYILQLLGIIGGATGVNAGAFVPFFVGNLLSYGVKGLIIGFIFFAVEVMIYVPFVKVYDKQQLAKERNIEGE